MKLFLKISNLCNHNTSTLRTDRQTDGQTTCDRNTALCTKVHRAVKIVVSVAVLKAKFASLKPNASVEGFVDNQPCLKTKTAPRSKNPSWHLSAKTLVLTLDSECVSVLMYGCNAS